MARQTFQEGDLVLRSLDGDLFHVHESNVGVACGSFPGLYLSTDRVVATTIKSSILKIVLHFLYPSRPPPDLRAVSFETLAEVFSLTREWEMPLAQEYCRLHFHQYVVEHPLAVLRLVEDCTPLLASLVPFIVNLTCGTLMEMGVSHRLCVHWANFREKSLFAMLEAEEVLDRHDSCAVWRKAVKPHLKDKVRDHHRHPTILLVKKDPTQVDPMSLCVQDVFESALAKVDQYWNARSSTDMHFMGRDNEEEEDEDMADEMEDDDSSLGLEPDFVRCCKTHLKDWRNVAFTKLSEVEF
ncbi:hypothetical protein BT96DRAFT_944215 [Gymnopus androsaceus JB14]|uniref:BTB domain-containing protein n=1 Tax=Gymnopus androsaceus JB14 TaxID=1447944 RepID=A0A6A4H777_9AGAR|nr:hypothetical protein BT96DRAFT_944215 [Gymnopus androsaceus JB14]